eukprot:scaffold277113_cov42-Prasinocladus_malaysianus.AAC.1
MATPSITEVPRMIPNTSNDLGRAMMPDPMIVQERLMMGPVKAWFTTLLCPRTALSSLNLVTTGASLALLVSGGRLSQIKLSNSTQMAVQGLREKSHIVPSS